MLLTKKDEQLIASYFVGKPVKRAFIFGSYSRNEATKDSDIDILVELDYTQHIGFGFAGMQIELTVKLKRKVDLVSSQGLLPRIKQFINRDKRLIYERQTRE